MRSYNLHDFIRILRNIPAQVTICTISYVAIGITRTYFYINYTRKRAGYIAYSYKCIAT